MFNCTQRQWVNKPDSYGDAKGNAFVTACNDPFEDSWDPSHNDESGIYDNPCDSATICVRRALRRIYTDENHL